MGIFPKNQQYGPEEFAERARHFLDLYRKELDATNPEIEDTHVTDLLTDIRHYCEREGIHFGRCLRISRDHHQEENTDV